VGVVGSVCVALTSQPTGNRFRCGEGQANNGSEKVEWKRRRHSPPNQFEPAVAVAFQTVVREVKTSRALRAEGVRNKGRRGSAQPGIAVRTEVAVCQNWANQNTGTNPVGTRQQRRCG